MEEVLKKIAEQQEKIDAIYVSVEKTRKYFMWTLIITVATVVLPLVAILVMLPFLLNSMSSLYNI
jgi:type IV secretory pathway component VirB8